MRYDVLIAGGSFAGLAVAAQLPGRRVIVLDRKPVGAHQTSACGTLVSTLEALHLEDAILQVHDSLVIHTPGREYAFDVGDTPFCTFDYQAACQLLLGQSDAEYLEMPATGCVDGGVQTPLGAMHAAFVVDATGWRAALRGEPTGALRREGGLNFGLEADVNQDGEGLHFFIDPGRLPLLSIGWEFPSGGRNRIGVGSYTGQSKLGGALRSFVADVAPPGVNGNGPGLGAMTAETVHGGFFPSRPGRPLRGDVFLVGDAAGQCLGLTGEGIRPALFFGACLGGILGRAVDGSLAPEAARAEYEALVARYRPGFRLMRALQVTLPRLPVPVLKVVIAALHSPPLRVTVVDRYLRAFPMPPVPGAVRTPPAPPSEVARQSNGCDTVGGQPRGQLT